MRLILLPGQLCDETVWAAQRSGLADIAAIDVGDLTQEDSVEAMAARVLDAAPSSFALAGLSLGGYVALDIVRRAPERVSHLALMNTSARPDSQFQSARRERVVDAARIGSFKGVTPRLLPTIVHPDHVGDPAFAAPVLAMTERVGRLAFEKQQHALMMRPDARPVLAGIRCPTLVVGGRADKITPPELQEEIARDIPGAQLEILEVCGHLAPLEQPAAVNRLMRAWLGG